MLVFANSLGTDFGIWRDAIVRLAGHFAIADHAVDLSGLVDLLNVKNAVICG